jgi:non-heme chloroperoxidase
MNSPFVTIADVHQLYFRDWGTGTPIVLLAGWSMDSRTWGATMIRLNAAGFRTVAYDRRGHGRSTDPGRYDYDVLADDLAAVLTTLDLEKAILVGHSGAGGEIIRYLARHGSEHVARVVLVGATGPRMIAPAEGEAGIPASMADTAVARLIDDLPGWIAENIEPFAPEADSETQSWLATMPRDASLRAIVDFQRSILYTDFTEEALRIDVPVTLVHGDADASAPIDWTARRYAEIIPDANLVVYKGGAHGLMITHAERLAADIQRAAL